MKASGRFASNKWVQSETVRVVTCDALIEQYGLPAFVKIDVEGFERNVLQGLSHPIRCLSLEFIPEYLDNTLACMDIVEKLASCRYNFSRDTREMRFSSWVDREELIAYLRSSAQDVFFTGDIYVQMGSPFRN